MKNIDFDYMNKTIIISNAFNKLARNYGSKEYVALTDAISKNPDFKIEIRHIKQKASKMTYKGLTYDTMKDYFTVNKADRAKYLCAKLDEMRGLKNGKRDVTMMVCSYAAIKAWFFSVCSEIESHNEEIQELCKKSKKEQRMNAPAEESTIQSGNSETTTSAETDIRTFTPTEVIKNTSLSVQEADRKVS